MDIDISFKFGIGIKKIDEKASVISSSKLTTIAAKRAVGKTAFALQVALHVANLDKSQKVIFFSGQMTEKRLQERLIAIKTHIPLLKIFKSENLSKKEQDAIKRTKKHLETSNLQIFDELPITPAAISEQVYEEQDKINLVVVDGIEMVLPEKQNWDKKKDEICQAGRELLDIAVSYNIPMLTCVELPSLPFDSEVNGMENLSNSTNLEKVSDTVITIFRPAIYCSVIDPGNATVVVHDRDYGKMMTTLKFDRDVACFKDMHDKQNV